MYICPCGKNYPNIYFKSGDGNEFVVVPDDYMVAVIFLLFFFCFFYLWEIRCPDQAIIAIWEQ